MAQLVQPFRAALIHMGKNQLVTEMAFSLFSSAI